MDSKLFSLGRKITKLETKDELNTKHILIWKIPNFMWLLNNQTNREISTQPREHTTADVAETEFQVKIEVVGRENDLIEIYYMAYDTMLVKPTCYVYFNAQSGYVEPNDTRLVDKNKWQFLTVCYKKHLAGKCPNNLTLQIEFLIAQETKNTLAKVIRVEDKKFDVPTEAETNMVDDVSTLLMNEAYSDVKLRSAEGEEFPAHKNFLGTRSPVLRAHFDHDMLESKTNIVESPFEAVVVKGLLTYIYTNAVPNIDHFPLKLLEAADYYQINGLKSLCETAMVKKLTLKNLIETLEFANKYRTVHLTRKTLEFIKNGAAADITETDGWRASRSADVIKSVYECVVRNKIE